MWHFLGTWFQIEEIENLAGVLKKLIKCDLMIEIKYILKLQAKRKTKVKKKN